MLDAHAGWGVFIHCGRVGGTAHFRDHVVPCWVMPYQNPGALFLEQCPLVPENGHPWAGKQATTLGLAWVENHCSSSSLLGGLGEAKVLPGIAKRASRLLTAFLLGTSKTDGVRSGPIRTHHSQQ